MSILPFIDLLILAGWTAFFGGFVLKLVDAATAYKPTLFGIGPIDFLMVGAVCLLLALTLSARTWVKAHETERAVARRKRNDEMEQRIAMLDGSAAPASTLDHDVPEERFAAGSHGG